MFGRCELRRNAICNSTGRNNSGDGCVRVCVEFERSVRAPTFSQCVRKKIKHEHFYWKT